jgi:hypothetical protein
VRKFFIIITFLLSAEHILIAGIHRHDIPEKKYRQLANQKRFDCVGQVFHNGKPSGTCVLIDKNYIITATHVLTEYDIRLDTIISKGMTAIVNVPYNQHLGSIENYSFKFGKHFYKGKMISAFPGFFDTVKKEKPDISVVRLTELVDRVAIPAINSNQDELHAEVIGVGFGASGRADKPETVKQRSLKIAGENVIDSISGFELKGIKCIMYCDFDSPVDTTCNKMGSPTPMPLEYICAGGDSGGGLFKKSSSHLSELLGICTNAPTNITQLMKTGYYGQIMGWTRISAFHSWIQSIILSKE